MAERKWGESLDTGEVTEMLSRCSSEENHYPRSGLGYLRHARQQSRNHIPSFMQPTQSSRVKGDGKAKREAEMKDKSKWVASSKPKEGKKPASVFTQKPSRKASVDFDYQSGVNLPSYMRPTKAQLYKQREQSPVSPLGQSPYNKSINKRSSRKSSFGGDLCFATQSSGHSGLYGR